MSALYCRPVPAAASTALQASQAATSTLKALGIVGTLRVLLPYLSMSQAVGMNMAVAAQPAACRPLANALA